MYKQLNLLANYRKIEQNLKIGKLYGVQHTVWLLPVSKIKAATDNLAA
jgi:hypothetical protein